MNLIDEPVDIRKDEELDVQKLEEFLKDNIPGLDGDITVKQFKQGYSNLTYLIQSKNRELVLRRPPFGKKAKTAHDMSREFRILKAIKPSFHYCPEPVLYSEDLSVIGCPFYVMERIRGIILRRDFPEGLHLPPQDVRKLCEKLTDVLCELHSIDYKQIGLENFGKPDGYVRRQVEGWSRRYRDAKTEDAPDYEKVMQWLHDNMPEDSTSPCVIHNDYRFDNVVLDADDPFKIIGVLDWEMSTIGDPLMDLGGALAYWTERSDPDELQLMRVSPTTVDGMLTRKEMVDLYLDKMGLKIDSFDFYLCFGIFRVAVISQQIYYRYFHGQTKDERFGMLIYAVKLFEEVVLRMIEGIEW